MTKLAPQHSPEEFNRMSAGRLPGLIGMEILSVEPKLLKSRLVLRPDHLAPQGLYLHAATLVAVADTTCGFGTIAHLPEGALGFTTIELKSNFLGTLQSGTILCEAVPEHLGRTTHVWDAVVTDEASGRQLALFRCTEMILWKHVSEGPGS